MNRIEQLASFLEQNPNDMFLNHALALEYVKINNYEQAIEQFNNNIQKDAYYLPTYYHLGKVYEKVNNYHSALQIYQQGLVIAQHHKDQKTFNEINMAIEFLEDEME